MNSALKDLKRELEDARFSRAAFGYRSADVDNFMDELERKLDVAIAERDELVGLIEKLKNEILSLRSEKEAITRAIVNSEKIAQASVIDAGVKSKYILRDASEKAAKMMNSANDEYERKISEAKKTTMATFHIALNILLFIFLFFHLIANPAYSLYHIPTLIELCPQCSDMNIYCSCFSYKVSSPYFRQKNTSCKNVTGVINQQL